MGLSSLPVPDPIVRPAELDDFAEVLRLLQAAGTELTGRKGFWLHARIDAPFATIEQTALDVLTSPWVTVIGTIDRVVVGVACGRIHTMHRDGAVGVIEGLYVEEGGRGVGVGDALLLELLDRFKAAGCIGVDSWALPGERETKNFYEAHGFSARVITVHHSFIGPMHESRTAGLREHRDSIAADSEGADDEA